MVKLSKRIGWLVILWYTTMGMFWSNRLDQCHTHSVCYIQLHPFLHNLHADLWVDFRNKFIYLSICIYTYLCIYIYTHMHVACVYVYVDADSRCIYCILFYCNTSYYIISYHIVLYYIIIVLYFIYLSICAYLEMHLYIKKQHVYVYYAYIYIYM